MRGYDDWPPQRPRTPARRQGGPYDRGWLSEGAPWRPPRWWGDESDHRYAGFNVPGRPRQWEDQGRPRGDYKERWPENQPSQYSQYGRRVRDAELQSAVRRSLFEDTSLEADEIDVDVEDGIVTLSGRVGDHLEARYAWDDAWETEGVEGVISRLEVTGKPSEPDESDRNAESGEPEEES